MALVLKPGENIFSRIASASASAGGNYFTKHGKYALGVKALRLRPGHKGTSYIGEFIVLEAEPNEHSVYVMEETGVDAEGNKIMTPKVDENGQPVWDLHKIGDTKSVVWNLTKHDAALGNVKALNLAFLGKLEGQIPDEELTEFMQEGTNDEQPLKGKLVVGDTYPKLIAGGPNAGKPIMLMNWYYIPEESGDWVARAQHDPTEWPALLGTGGEAPAQEQTA
jgi:hypothetical protein